MIANFLSTLAKNKIGRVLVIVLLIMLLTFFEFIDLNTTFIKLGQDLVQPVMQINVQLGVKLYQTAQNVRSWHNAAHRIRDLELKLAQTSAQLSQIEQLEKENQELRQLLNSSDRSLGRVVLTSPILSLAQPAVGLPREASVKPGLAVLVENTLVGVVTEIRLDIAYLGLLWQKDCPFVLAETEAGVQGLISGDGRRVLLTEVPIEDELEVGQRVVTSGQEGIEAGLYIGQIRSIHSGTSAATKTAVIEQLVSFYDTTLVEIKL